MLRKHVDELKSPPTH